MSEKAAWGRLRSHLAGARERFVASIEHAQETQCAQLREILAVNRETDFGRTHSFERIANDREYRDAVPIRRYEDFAPWIERTHQLCAEPVVAFERTGGSTSGAKLIPYTERGLAAFRRAVLPWLDDLLLARPAIAAGRIYWSISPVVREVETTPGGVPIGLESDAAYLGRDVGEAISELLAVPPSVARAHSFEEWRELTAQHLRDATDLTLISVWSPTFLLELLGDLSEPCWTRLDTISCWTSAASARFACQLAARFPGVYVQGKGLLATECAVTIPLADRPFPVLAVESGFFEFIDDHGTVRLAHELEQDADYRVILTTHSGLYRYDIGDRVRMRGWAQSAPMLEFTGRAGVVSDVCGEKLTEDFVLPRLERIRGFAALAPSSNGRPHYDLILDSADYSLESAGALAGHVDRALRDNPQYDYARNLRQLGAVTPRLLARPLERYYACELSRGRRAGDIKPPVLLFEDLE